MALPAIGTHQPLLFGACLRTSGPVLELGSGSFSTPFIHSLAVAQKRRCVTLDTNYEYYSSVKPYASELHEILYLPGFARNDEGKLLVAPGKSQQWHIDEQTRCLTELCARHGNFDVAFVDQAPAFMRQPAARFLADRATYVIVHDTNESDYYRFDFSGFKHRYEDRSAPAWTTILSNSSECESFRAFVTSQSLDEAAVSALTTRTFGPVELGITSQGWVRWRAAMESPSPDSFLELVLQSSEVMPDEVQVILTRSDRSSTYFWATIWKGDRFVGQADRSGRVFVPFSSLAMVGSEPLEAMDLVEVRARSVRPVTVVLPRVNLGNAVQHR